MIRKQNMRGKAILMGLIPILVGAIYDDIIWSKTPFNGQVPINEVKEVLIHKI